MSATEVVLCKLSNATQIQRLIVENFIVALLRNAHLAHHFEIRPENKHYIAILPNRLNPPTDEVLGMLEHALARGTAAKVIAYQNENIGLISNPTQGVSLPGIRVTALHPELLVHALKKELAEGAKIREHGEESNTIDPIVLSALPLVIRENLKNFSESLINHINVTTIAFLKKQESQTSTPNNSSFFTNMETRNQMESNLQFPQILVQFKDKKTNDDEEPMDLMQVLVSPNISRKSFKLLVPATNTAASFRARKSSPSLTS